MSQRSRVGGTASGCPRLHDVQAPLAWRPQVGGTALTDVPGFMMVWPPCTMAASGWWHCPRVSQAPRPVFRPAKGSCTIRSSLGRCLGSYPSERSNTHHKASRGGPARICSCVSGGSTRPLLFWPSQVYNSFSLWFFLRQAKKKKKPSCCPGSGVSMAYYSLTSQAQAILLPHSPE